MILIIHPQQFGEIFAAFRAAFVRTTPPREVKELAHGAGTTGVRFRYSLARAYEDVTGVVLVVSPGETEEWDRIVSVTHFCAQQSLSLIVVSGASMLNPGRSGDYLRRIAAHVEATVTKHFIVGTAPIESLGGGVAAEVAGLLDNGWFGRFHAVVDAGAVRIYPVQRRDVPQHGETAASVDRPRL